jgi:antitoxin ParD1/3/4
VATMNISLPDKMKTWVEEQAKSGRYSNASDYLRDLIRRDEERTLAIAEMQALIDEGLASGVSDKSPEDVFEEARRKFAAERAAPDAA